MNEKIKQEELEDLCNNAQILIDTYIVTAEEIIEYLNGNLQNLKPKIEVENIPQFEMGDEVIYFATTISDPMNNFTNTETVSFIQPYYHPYFKNTFLYHLSNGRNYMEPELRRPN
jgi:hypothetical protein